MITVITEHTTLITARAKARRHGHGAKIIEAINRALGDTTAQLIDAIENLGGIAVRTHAMTALKSLERHAGTIAELDAVLEAAAMLPGDLDVDDEVARMRYERETNAADLTRNTTVLVHALADARVDRVAEAPVAEQRCPECGTIAPGHSTVHERYPEGGGGTNRPCSRAAAAS